MTEDRVLCENPVPGKQELRIKRWKYDLIREAMLALIPAEGEGIAFRDLPDLLSARLTPDQRNLLGSMAWYATVVKLDLEAKGEISRVPGSRPQRLVRPSEAVPQP
jgi:hypothetical protein